MKTNMKTSMRITIIVATLFLTLSFAACTSASGGDGAEWDEADYSGYGENSVYPEDSAYDMYPVPTSAPDYYPMYESEPVVVPEPDMPMYTPSGSGGSGGGETKNESAPAPTVPTPTVTPVQAVPISQNTASLSEMLIYMATVRVETTEFEAAVKGVNDMLGKFDAFFESSTVTATKESYTYGLRLRDASYTIRVPKNHFQSLLDSLPDLGNVLSLDTNASNITAQYTDTDSRLTTFRTEEERLLSMLEKADTVEDMLAIENRISTVRYQIESLTATLRNWDNQVNYSTVVLSITEVEDLTNIVPYQRSYAQQLGDGFMTTLRATGGFFKGLFKEIVTALPVLAVLAVILIVILLIVRRVRRSEKGKQRAAAKLAKNRRMSQAYYPAPNQYRQDVPQNVTANTSGSAAGNTVDKPSNTTDKPGNTSDNASVDKPE